MEHFIIDTDPGLDDAQAILMAAHHPDVTIDALTVVAGNVGLDHTLRNSCLLVDLVGQEIPVYPGAANGLVYTGEDASYFHGKDGFGDANLPDPTTKPEAQHAALAIINLVKASPGEKTLIALGPLTNVALALHLEPGLPSLLKRLVIMGGAVTSKGNAPNLTTEFNFYADPEAAFFVMDQWRRAGKLAEIVDWEATVRHKMEMAWVTSLIEQENQAAQFVEKITRNMRNRLRRDVFYAADPLAMAVALEPTIVTHAEDCFMRIETEGPRGQSTVDWEHRSGFEPNARVVLTVDQKRFEALYTMGVAG